MVANVYMGVKEDSSYSILCYSAAIEGSEKLVAFGKCTEGREAAKNAGAYVTMALEGKKVTQFRFHGATRFNSSVGQFTPCDRSVYEQEFKRYLLAKFEELAS